MKLSSWVKKKWDKTESGFFSLLYIQLLYYMSLLKSVDSETWSSFQISVLCFDTLTHLRQATLEAHIFFLGNYIKREDTHI